MFIVKFNNKFLVKEPYWNGGSWTEDESKATRYGEDSAAHFARYYPQFEMVLVT